MPVIASVADERWVIDSVGGLDEILDRLASGVEAVLVELACRGVVLNVGVGRDDVAVALFRASDGRPWSARTRRDLPAMGHVDLRFSKNGTSHQFYPHATLRPDEMREVAREFVRSHGARPTVVDWVAEPVDDERR